MKSSPCRTTMVVALTCVILSSGCDLFTDPPDPILVSFSFDLGSASAATAKIESAQIRISHASGAFALDTTVPVSNGAVGTGALEIPLESPDEVLTVKVDLLGGGLILFQGTAPLQAAPGSSLSSSVPVVPVVSMVAIEGPLPVFEAIGDEWPLVGYAMWSSGDTIPGAELEWSSSDLSVAEVTGKSLLVARGEGETTVKGQLGERFETQQARVEAVVVAVVIEPEDLTVPRGREIQLSGVARDANGNDLVREVGWTSADPAIAAVDATGVLTALNPGLTSVVADVNQVLGSADVEVTPAPPTVSPLEAAEPGTRSVDLVMDINPNGATTTFRVEWSLAEGFETPNATSPEAVGGGLDDVRLETGLTRLDPSTDHFVRIVASNSYGETTGDAVAFRTADPTGGFIEGFLTAEGEGIGAALLQLDGGETTSTDGAGGYAFDDVALGLHEVTVVELPLGVTIEEPTASGDVQAVGDLVRLDFEGEIVRTSSIRGQVIASEIGVPGVTVALSGPDNATTTTDTDGLYAFEAIRAGSYTVSLDDFDRAYLSFEEASKEVSVGLDEEGSAGFLGVDTDVMDVTVHAFVGIDGTKPGLSPVPGVDFGVFATSSDANLRSAPLGTAATNASGRAVIRIRKRDDTGEDGGASDERVWTGVISTGSNLSIQADRVMSVRFDPESTAVEAPDTVDIINGRAKIRVGVETIKTSASDSGLRLRGWKTHAFAEPGGSPIASSASQSGAAVITVSRAPNDLPQTLYFRLDSDQSEAFGNDWVQTPDPSGSGAASGGYLQYTMDGLEPVTGSVGIGKMVVRYNTMVIWTTAYHEVDNTKSSPVRSRGDDVVGATAIRVTLKRNGSTVNTRGIASNGHIPPFNRQPVPNAYTLSASSTNANITIITSGTLTVGSTGGGSVGRTDSQGGYRHSARVCPLSADTIISNCAGWAYKFNNTRVRGTVTRSGGGGASGVEVRLARCRTPQGTSSSACAAEDGFVRTTSTGGSGGYAFSGLLEGIYEVSVTGTPASTLVATQGSGNEQSANLVIP